MNLRWLTLEGFRSFRKRTTFDLRTFSAFVHIAGDNGAGKSSLMEALYWCLYGKTSRGVRAGNVRSWQSEQQCLVSLRLEKDGTSYDVTRTWGPNSLRIDKRNVEQAEVNALVGLSEDEFLHSPFGQRLCFQQRVLPIT